MRYIDVKVKNVTMTSSGMLEIVTGKTTMFMHLDECQVNHLMGNLKGVMQSRVRQIEFARELLADAWRVEEKPKP